MTNPMIAAMEALLAEALAGGQDSAFSQVAEESRSQFADLHEVAHFLRDRIGEELAGVMVHSNLPQLLVGNPEPGDGRKLEITAACDQKPPGDAVNAFIVDVRFDGVKIMTLGGMFWPQV